MKKLMTFTAVLIALLLSTLTTSAMIPPTNRAAEMHYIQNLIDSHIDFPKSWECYRVGFVKARISISQDQKIVVEAINGYPELSDFVKRRLENTVVAYPRFIGREYICKVDFRK